MAVQTRTKEIPWQSLDQNQTLGPKCLPLPLDITLFLMTAIK